MRVRYTLRAVAELDDILAYIAERSPQGARGVQARIQATIALVAEQPGSGRPTRNPRLRRIVATPYPYLIFYELRDAEIVIVGIRHGARRPGSMPGAGPG